MLKLENLNKPSDPKWKKVADWLLYSVLPAANGMFIYIESKNIISPEFAMWGVAISSFLIASFKGITKFTADESIQ